MVKNTDLPLVSIIAPMYNIESFVIETINSVLNQTYSNFELILIDDKSPDNTVKEVKNFDDPRIRLIVNEQNLGAGETRNVGIRAATGDMIAFLDADDRWYPQKLEKQISFMQETGSAICYTLYDVIDANGRVYADCGYIPDTATYHRILRRNYIRTSSLLFDVKKVGGKVYFPTIRKRQDMLLFLDLIKRVGRADLLAEVTCSYRMHPGGISANKRSVIPYQWAAYRNEEKLPLAYCVFLMAAWFTLAGAATLRRRMKERKSRQTLSA